MSNINFLIISKEAWGDTRWARKQWLPYFLSKRVDVGKIIYLDRHAAWWRGESSHDKQSYGKIKVVQRSLLLPLEKILCVQSFNRQRIAKSIAQEMGRKEVWVSIIYHPFDLGMMNTLKKHSQVIFDWTEDWGTFHAESKVSELQKACVEQADIVFTVTKSLYDRAVLWRGSSEKVYHVSNATSFNVTSKTIEPIEIKNIDHPRIGFVGHAGPWFDEKLVAHLADAKPDWQWLMVGGATEGVRKALFDKPNVHWLGVHKPEAIPDLMAHCDVLVAPYIKGIQGDATKLYDYLVVKKPILSTTCETSEVLKKWVVNCEGKDDWLDNLSRLISVNKLEISNETILNNHWSTRAEMVVRILKGTYE